MSSENPAKSYAHHYLVPQPPVREDEWLRDLVPPQPGWQVLELDDHTLNANFTPLSTDLVVLRRGAIPAGDRDLFPVVQAAAEALKPGGLLLVWDVNLPDHDRAAYYVNAFYRLRDANHQPGYAPYQWRGMLLDAGLGIEHTDTLRLPVRLLDWASACPPVVIERLQVMLKQAPPLVADHLRPFAIGTSDAMFTHSLMAIVARKP